MFIVLLAVGVVAIVCAVVLVLLFLRLGSVVMLLNELAQDARKHHQEGKTQRKALSDDRKEHANGISSVLLAALGAPKVIAALTQPARASSPRPTPPRQPTALERLVSELEPEPTLVSSREVIDEALRAGEGR